MLTDEQRVEKAAKSILGAAVIVLGLAALIRLAGCICYWPSCSYGLGCCAPAGKYLVILGGDDAGSPDADVEPRIYLDSK